MIKKKTVHKTLSCLLLNLLRYIENLTDINDLITIDLGEYFIWTTAKLACDS